MSLKFGEAKNINVGGMQIIPIRTEDDKPFYVTLFFRCETREVQDDVDVFKIRRHVNGKSSEYYHRMRRPFRKTVIKKGILQRQHDLPEVETYFEIVRRYRRSGRFQIRG